MYYLPQYSPELAPVELIFGAIKRKLTNEVCRQGWNFSSKSGKEKIVQAWEEISADSIASMWVMVIKQAKRCVWVSQKQILQQKLEDSC